jgi:tetratricopeptide (TPR) repeat protein
MRKTTLLLSFALLVGVAFGAALARATQAKQPQYKSPEEGNAYNTLYNEKDPAKKISLAEAFIQKFPDTDFKEGVYYMEMKAYQQLNDVAKVTDAARKVVEVNPDNIEAYGVFCLYFPYAFKADDPEAAAKLAGAETMAQKGLEALQRLQKPASVTDEQFNQYVKVQRAIANNGRAFVALQRKDYAAAITSLKAAVEDDPSDFLTFYRLGLAYLYSSPPDYDNGVWNLGRSVALAKAAQKPGAEGIEKDLKRVYIGYHGNDEGLPDIIAQAGSSPTPPEGFKVSPMEVPKPTGNASIDGFNQTFFQLKLGGERAQKLWDGLKGEPFGVGGFVESVEKGTEAGVYLVRIDVLNQSKAADGMYDMELRDSTQPNVKNLGKGDAVHFKGTISAYTVTPSLVITLDRATINDDEIPDQPKVAPKPKPKAKPRATTPTRRTTRRPPA